MIALLLTDRCTQCQRCVVVCPANVLEKREDASPSLARPNDCQTCFACELYCEADAIYVDPDCHQLIDVTEEAVKSSGTLGQYRRDSGWHEWSQDERYRSQHWRMGEVFARGYAMAQVRDRS